MLAAFGDIVQEPGKGRLLDLFKLGLHSAEVGGKLQLETIIEVNLVGWVDTGQLEVVAHLLPEGGERFLPDLRHQEERGANVEAVTVADDLVGATTGSGFLFQHSHIVSVPGKPGGSRDPTDPCTDHNSSCFLHDFS